MKRQAKAVKFSLVSLTVCLGLAACQATPPQTSSNEMSGESTKQVTVLESGQTESANSKDSFADLEQLLKQNPAATVAGTVYQSDQIFSTTEQNFDVNVDMIRAYDIKQVDEKLKSEFNFDEQKGGLVVAHVSIKNKTKETIYYPIEELKLSFNEATTEVAPSFQLYPADAGNLALSLSDNKGVIEAGQTVEGYLVYGIGGSALDHMKKDGYFYLKVVPPKRNESDITGVGANALGDEQLLYLPLNKDNEALLLENAKHSQDRLTTEFWGHKTILADDNLNLKESSEGVTVNLKRIEVSDFEPNQYNVEAFRNFKYGAVIVSVEYTVTNNTKQTLLPVDATSTLTINGDPISNDYVLTNQGYGKELAPGQSFNAIKTFALDKSRYHEAWQGHAYDLTIGILEKGPEVDSGAMSSSSESEDSANQESSSSAVPEQKTYQVKFNLTPKLLKEYDADLKLKTLSTPLNQPASSTSSQSSKNESDESSSAE